MKKTFWRSGFTLVASNHLLALTLIFLGLPGLLPAQTITHRYSFVSNANDSVGSANGTLKPQTTGTAATINNGLHLPGSSSGTVSGYVQLPTGIVVGDSSVTVECWLTQAASRTFAEAWDFGCLNGTDVTNFAFIPVAASSPFLRAAFTPANNEADIDGTTAFPSGVEEYTVVSYNSTGRIGNMYTNGVLAGTTTFANTSYSPGSFGGAAGTTFNVLGADRYADAQFDGTIYEVRIWNGAVSSTYITASTMAGPGVVVANSGTPTATIVEVATNMPLGGVQQATVSVTLPTQIPSGSTNVVAAASYVSNWTSGNTGILTVSSSGLVTAVGTAGQSTTISATVLGVQGSTTIAISSQTTVLEHRYSFASTANDSAGTANGTLVLPAGGTTATISSGLQLPGSGGGTVNGYLSLPSGLIVGDTNITVECWLTQNAVETWAEVWDFGCLGGVDTTNFGFIPVANASPYLRTAFTPANSEVDLDGNTAFPNGQEEYTVVTYNNSTLAGNMYTNGVLAGTQTFANTSYSPASYGGAGGTTFNVLGADRFGDNQFDGTIYEFRIWNGVVSPLYMALSLDAGPGTLITNTNASAITVTFTNYNMIGSATQQAILTGTFPQITTNIPASLATWSSGNTNILTVNSSGLVTAVGSGSQSTTITAVFEGLTNTSAPITIQSTAPVITTPPANLSLNVGDTAVFNVVAIGGSLSYQWYLGAAPIGTNGPTLTLPNITLASQGTYSVVVSNSISNATASATLSDAAALLHRYSFISNANDSVGTANGTIVPPAAGAAATIANGLHLPGTGTSGTPSGYVSLPNNLLSGDTNLTIECWVTQASAREWGEVWSFGDVGGNTNFGLIPDSATGNTRVAFTPNGGGSETDIDATGLATGSELYTVVTYDDITLTGNLYVNGVLAGATTFGNATYSPGTSITAEDALGLDPFGGDDQFSGTIYEFRIWNGAVSPLYIAASTMAGPSVVVSDSGIPTATSVESAVTMPVGGIQQASVVVTLPTQIPAAGSITVQASSFASNWISGNTGILTVSSSGVITAVGTAGQSTTVSATVNGVQGSSALITISSQPIILEHRYSFASTANDSAGTCNGTLVAPSSGAAATIANGLSLPGTGTTANPSGYLSLPNGLLLGDTNITVECWVTQNTQNTWGQIYSFGDAGGGTNFGLIPTSGAANGPAVDMRAAFTPNGGETDINDASETPLPTGVEEYITVTYNNSTLTGNLYTNGVLDGTQIFANATYSPGSYITTEDVLGIDPFASDAQFNGTIYELRIWNGVVTPLYQALSLDAGPGTLITNTTAASIAVTFTNYSMIGSATQPAILTGTFPQITTNIPNSLATWTSGNTNILTVDANGNVTAVGSGSQSTTITAVFEGLTNTSAPITIESTAPVITTPPANVTLNVGDTAVFNVVAIGGSLSYQWSFGAAPIGTNGPTLTLPNITLASQGTYSVVVSNSISNATASATLTDAAALVHRFSFTNTSGTVANDEVGTATATLQGSAYFDGVGNVQLPSEGTVSSSPNATDVHLSPGILTNSPSMSIEVWATDIGSEVWAELVCIGGTTSSALTNRQGQTNYISIIPHSGNGNDQVMSAFKVFSEQDVYGPANTPLPTDTPEYIVLNYDAQMTTATIYLNGVLQGIATNITVTPQSLGNTYDNFLGSDQYGGDPNFVGSIAEFRTWTGPVSPLYQALSLAAGSSVVITNTTASAITLTVSTYDMALSSTQPVVLTGTFPQITTALPGSFATNWTTSDPTILTVDTNGNVTAVGAPGTYATVSAMFQGMTATSAPITNDTAPTVNCPANITDTNASGQCGNTESFAAATTGIPAPTVTYQIPVVGPITSPYFFPVGTTTVSVSADNGSGLNTPVTCSFTVTVTETPPIVPGAFSMGAVDGSTASVPVGKVLLLATETSPPGGALSISNVTSPTATGATVTLSGGGTILNYTPLGNYTGPDTIYYCLSDGCGMVQGIISVTVNANGGGNNFSYGAVVGGDLYLQFFGIPGTNYWLQESPTVNGPTWTDVPVGVSGGNVNANPVPANGTGMINYIVYPILPSPAFYRTSPTP